MSPPVALVAVHALVNAALSAVSSEGVGGAQHKKLILLLLAQTVVQVYPEIWKEFVDFHDDVHLSFDKKWLVRNLFC